MRGHSLFHLFALSSALTLFACNPVSLGGDTNAGGHDTGGGGACGQGTGGGGSASIGAGGAEMGTGGGGSASIGAGGAEMGTGGGGSASIGAGGAEMGGAAGSGGASAVSDCEAQAGAVEAACNGQADRTCLFDHYKTLMCPTERADMLAAGLACLNQFSQGSCRTFSDPSGAAACVKAAFDQFDLTNATALATLVHTRCPSVDVDQVLYAAEPPFAVLTDTDIATATACINAAADCDAIAHCFTQFQQVANCPN